MRGRLKSLQNASLQMADRLEGGCGLKEVVGKGDPRAERRKKVVEQLLHKSQHPGAVADLPQEQMPRESGVRGDFSSVLLII